ncbi:hypothetical protein NW762_003205 [Fusarium torreyae]|uniref:Uncharacterized protein n=1 Tax=Fusarium torreyae TaxID=1237075 RepID=A0A9W8SAJ2_9HYPO|nr:hypothetical protein NW762_003205 [Fusarium torreyae]
MERRDEAYFLSADSDAKTKEMSVLDCHTARILMHAAEKVEDVSFVAVLAVEHFHPKRGKATRKRSPIEATINVYGPRHLIDDVDQVLSEVDAYLQHPVFLEPEIAYFNPQYLYPDQEKIDLRHLIGPIPEKAKSDTSRAIDEALECLDGWAEVSPTNFEVNKLDDIINPFLIDTRLKDRFRPQALKTAIFHGNKRVKEGHSLLGNDVVLTTYHTLEKDNTGCKVLKSINWSRIVLDEAHQIRNSTIKISKAAVSLESETRWYLTGTPIQNSFDDLRSLLQFLRFEPFCQNKVFEEHIIKPFRPDQGCGVDPSRNLRAMLKTCCLRRTQTKLNLPSVTTQRVTVTPTEAEKASFTHILEQCREDFDRIAGKDMGSKKPNVLFSAIMKLRRVCNHGIIPIDVTNPKRSSQLAVPKTRKNGSRSLSTEPGCDFCGGKNDDDDVLLENLDSCPLCGRLQPGKDGDMYNLALSPQGLSPSSFVGTPTSEPDTPGYTTSKFNDLPPSIGLMEQSSKMSAVVESIKASCLDDDSKSVVFSSWRDTLDILARILFANGIEFVQVDGRNPLTGRTELLSRFRESPSVRVLLISINTGAVGLTLTEANMVHIVEPQWNPSIEEQAVARVVRMGQTRPVTIFKYITAGSVEQTVVKLQEKKTRIIKLSMQNKDDADSDMNLDSFKFAIDPNEWQ